MAILGQVEAGIPVPELCREHGHFYTWRAKHGGIEASIMARLRELKEENRRLKSMIWWWVESLSPRSYNSLFNLDV